MRRGMEDFWRFDDNGYLIAERYDLSELLSDGWLSKLDLTVMDGPLDDQIVGDLDGNETFPGDIYEYDLLAGVTYSFSLRGTAVDGIKDPFTALWGPDGTFILQDDEGGSGHAALFTFTPTVSGTYSVLAGSWVNIFTAGVETGGYELDMWTPDTTPDAPNTLEGAFTLEEGVTIFGNITSSSDADMYKMDLVAGRYYTFNAAGGAGTNGEAANAGTVVAKVELLNSAGQVIATHSGIDSGVGIDVTQSGTYYVRITPTSGVGGYTLDTRSTVLAEEDPLEAFHWDSADEIETTDVNGVETAYVYFAVAGENFGEVQGDGGGALVSLGWNAFEQQQVMLMLEQYEFITGINYEVTTDSSIATFRLITTTAEPYGARFYPNDVNAYGTQTGIGTFNTQSHAWTFDANGAAPGSQQSLLQGGFAWELLLHEFGHAHGIAHPHDTGGGSEVMQGVFSSTGSLGAYNLNQSVYSVMSYNSTWHTGPWGATPFAVPYVSNGNVGTLSAFDIAVLQDRYGEVARNTGDNVYTLVDTRVGAMFQTIWDSGGNDTIAHNGTLGAQIDLLAATLDYSPTGGGVVSFIINDPSTTAGNLVRGGFTIANGVVIENATGGSGNDVLLGNAAANILTGNAGNDVLMGRQGADQLRAGAGNDTVNGGDGIDVAVLGDGDDDFVLEGGHGKSSTKTGSYSWDVITDFDGLGDDQIDLSGLAGDFHFIGTNANKSTGAVSYKSYTSITGAEKALGIDIDGQPGASGVSGPVTIVYVNTENGGSPDIAVVLLNTSSVDSGDFIWG